MNPRKRRMIKSGLLQKILDEQKKQAETQEKTQEQEVVDLPETKQTTAPMDSFIAKELQEIERIPSEKKKTTKKKVTKKKTTTKTKKGSK